MMSFELSFDGRRWQNPTERCPPSCRLCALVFCVGRIATATSRFRSHGFGEDGGGQVSLFDRDSVPWCFAASTPFAEVDWNLLSVKAFATDPRTLCTVRMIGTKNQQNLCIDPFDAGR
jgi:hypothetical protein